MKILLTGGSGLLGTELRRIFKLREFDKNGEEIHYPSSKELDITNPIEFKTNFDLIIHCAAYTDVVKAEQERDKCFLTNVYGTYNLINRFPNAMFVYISSEYVKNPINFYSYSKLIGESMVQKFARKYLIIRTSFVANPFPHEKAFGDQHTTGDYVDVIAPMIIEKISLECNRIIDVGTYSKTMYELALRTKPNVGKNSVDDIKNVRLPKNNPATFGDYL